METIRNPLTAAAPPFSAGYTAELARRDEALTSLRTAHGLVGGLAALITEAEAARAAEYLHVVTRAADAAWAHLQRTEPTTIADAMAEALKGHPVRVWSGHGMIRVYPNGKGRSQFIRVSGVLGTSASAGIRDHGSITRERAEARKAALKVVHETIRALVAPMLDGAPVNHWNPSVS